MKDVAKLAGTSVAVVSYVLNNGPRPVSEKTRERVQRAVAELGYRVNSAGRILRSRKSKIIGLVVPDSSHPFFADISRRIERSTYENGYVVLIGNSLSDPQREGEYFELFLEHQVDGLILTVDPGNSIFEFTRAGVPVVLLDEPSPELPVHSVTVDNQAGAFGGTLLLVEEGHKHIGFIGGRVGLPSADLRYEGWAQALRLAGLSDVLVERSEFSREGGYFAGTRLLSRGDDRPTAIFVSSDQQAIGLLRACSEHGLRVPDDVSVVAFDDSDDALYTAPPLTTIRQPMNDIVSRALEILLDPPPEPVRELQPYEIVRRASTNPSAAFDRVIRSHKPLINQHSNN